MYFLSGSFQRSVAPESMWVKDAGLNVAYNTSRKVKYEDISLYNVIVFSLASVMSLFEMSILNVVLSVLLVPKFNVHDGPVFNFPHFDKLSGLNTLSAVGLGFLLALLIFIDQNIVISLTHVPEHK